MENYKNMREDNDLFPYEYGASGYSVKMFELIKDFIRRESDGSNLDLIRTYLLDRPNNGFPRELLKQLSRYMNYRIRYPRHAEVLINDNKLRQLLEPLAKIICTEKSIFEEWVKKNPNGYGEYSYPNGKTYVGEWKDGKYHGQGILSRSGRLIYEGEWANGKRNGHGTTITKDDKLGYNGEWKDDKYHGQGIRFWEKDVHELKYEGEWKNGNENGQGELTISSCDKRDLSFYVYAGEWKDGDRWNGLLYDKDGNITANYVNGVIKK